MGKRARKAALMGFVGGMLSDVKSRWETKRAEEAERLKEERLMAIRQMERQEDRSWRKEDYATMRADTVSDTVDQRGWVDKNSQLDREFRTASDERNFSQQRQLAGEARAASAAEGDKSRAHSERLASMKTPAEKAAKMETYVGSSGRTVQLNMNKAKDVQALKDWSKIDPKVRPFAPAYADEGIGAETGGGGAAAPVGADLVWDAKLRRLVPAKR